MRVNERAAGAPKASILLVRFGERPRQVRTAVLLTVVLSVFVLAWSRPAAAAVLVVLPLLIMVRYQRRALVVVRPDGPIVVKGWWHDTTVQPRDVTSVQWQRRGDSAWLRIVMGDVHVDCLSVAIPTGGQVRRGDRGWPKRVDTLIEALADVGVHPFALDPLRVSRG